MNSLATYLDIAVAMGFLGFVALVGILAFRKGTEEDFYVCGRNLGPFKLAGTMAAGLIGGGVLLVFSEYAYEYGVAALCIFAGLALGLIGLLWVAKRYKSVADENRLYTVPELFAHLWGDVAGYLATVVVIGWSLGFVVMQLAASGLLLSELLPLSRTPCIFIAAFFVLAYVTVGGLRAVVITDVLQYFSLVVFFILVSAFIWPKTDFAAIQGKLKALSIGDGVGFLLLGGLNVLVSADLWQRIYAAKSTQAARRGLCWAALLVVICGAALVMPALYARSLAKDFTPNRALVQGLANILPHGVLGLAFAMVLCAVMSTLDTMVFVLGFSVGNDVFTRALRRAPERRLAASRIAMVVFTLVAALLTFAFPNLLDIGLALSSLGLCLVPAVIGGLWMKLSREAVCGSLLSGLAGFLCLAVAQALTPLNAVATFPVALVGCVLGGLVSRIRRR